MVVEGTCFDGGNDGEGCHDGERIGIVQKVEGYRRCLHDWNRANFVEVVWKNEIRSMEAERIDLKVFVLFDGWVNGLV